MRSPDRTEPTRSLSLPRSPRCQRPRSRTREHRRWPPEALRQGLDLLGLRPCRAVVRLLALSSTMQKVADDAQLVAMYSSGCSAGIGVLRRYSLVSSTRGRAGDVGNGLGCCAAGRVDVCAGPGRAVALMAMQKVGRPSASPWTAPMTSSRTTALPGASHRRSTRPAARSSRSFPTSPAVNDPLRGGRQHQRHERVPRHVRRNELVEPDSR